MKSFRDKNLDIVIMHRDTDATHEFTYQLDSGSTFVPSLYTITCEGRVAYANEVKDFDFPVTEVIDDDGVSKLVITFPKEIVTSYIRENKIYWKVFATENVEGGKTIVIGYGEIWLK